MTGKTIFVGPGEGPALRIVGDTVRVLAAGPDTGGAYEIFELSGPRGSGPPPHAHPWNEAYVMLEGEAEILLDGGTRKATAGCFVNIPAGALHSYRVLSEAARFIVVTSPSGAAEFFAELDRETGGSTEDLAKIVQVATRHGFTVPPPN
ncbi:MAG TPA: cupin domain-containing protein [Pyrinomonadaceae bacterium]|nr:cupin domain-containing protein [Pyrinomonadaceae bacterium]